eukprot:317349_1
MTECNELEKWLKDNNLSKILDVDTLDDNGVSEFSELLDLSHLPEDEINEYIEELNLQSESDINKFKTALSTLSRTSVDVSDLSQNAEINKMDNNQSLSETEIKMSHDDVDGDDSNKNHTTQIENVQYKALLKNGLNIVASKKREYIISKLEENEYK